MEFSSKVGGTLRDPGAKSLKQILLFNFLSIMAQRRHLHGSATADDSPDTLAR